MTESSNRAAAAGRAMIISASYRTDIPTFYDEWFMNRPRAGYCKVVNPYNRRISHVDLNPAAVDGFVFWTKNVGPFREQLREVGVPLHLEDFVDVLAVDGNLVNCVA